MIFKLTLGVKNHPHITDEETELSCHAVEGLGMQIWAECDPKACAPTPSLYCLPSSDLSLNSNTPFPVPGLKTELILVSERRS